MSEFRFKVYTNLGSVYKGSLELHDVSFNDPVTGNASLGAAAYLTESQTAADLKAIITPDNWITVEHGTSVLFGGPFVARKWSSENKVLSFAAVHWRQWLYQLFLRVNLTTFAEVSYTWTAKDQLQIFRELIQKAVVGQSTPLITYDASLSGVTRNLTVSGSEFKYVAELIDTMSSRDGGFEWGVEIVRDSLTNLLKLKPTPYFPQRGGQKALVVLKDTPNGGNLLSTPDYEESFADRRTRVWATGEGQPPDQPITYDEDPDLATKSTLLTETVSNWSGVTNRTTLTGHARSERSFRAVPVQEVKVEVGLTDPEFTTYSSGDRVRVILEDEWLSVDYPSVRILDREFSLNREDAADTVALTIDLNDIVLPEADTEGSSESA